MGLFTLSRQRHTFQRWVLLVTLPRFIVRYLHTLTCTSTGIYFNQVMHILCKSMLQSSVSRNAREIKEYIEEIYWGARKRVLLLGHSKGGVDSAAALSLYWPQLKDKVAGLVLAQSPYGGSPVASDILREGQLGDYVRLRKIMEILVSKVLKVLVLVISKHKSACTLDNRALDSVHCLAFRVICRLWRI